MINSSRNKNIGRRSAISTVISVDASSCHDKMAACVEHENAA